MGKIAYWNTVRKHRAKGVGPVVDKQHIIRLAVAYAAQILYVDAWVQFDAMFTTEKCNKSIISLRVEPLIENTGVLLHSCCEHHEFVVLFEILQKG